MKQRIVEPDIAYSLRDTSKQVASRMHELKGLRGWRWLVHRIRIERWAWNATAAKTKGLDQRV